MKNVFLDDLDRRVAGVTPERLLRASISLKSLSPMMPKVLGILDPELQKLWVVIDDLTEAAHKHGRSMSLMASSGPSQEEIDKAVKAAILIREHLKAVEQFFWSSLRSQYYWDKSLAVGQGWEVAEVTPPEPANEIDVKLSDLLSGLRVVGSRLEPRRQALSTRHICEGRPHQAALFLFKIN